MKANPVNNSDGHLLGYRIDCPGCSVAHIIHTEEPNASGAKWSFNGDIDRPTFSPSVLRRFGHQTCHSFVRDGRIQFLGDCTHKLAGQTVDLPDIEPEAAA